MHFCIASLKYLFERVNASAIINFTKDISFYNLY